MKSPSFYRLVFISVLVIFKACHMTQFVPENSNSSGLICCIVHHLQKTMWSCFLFLKKKKIVYFNFSVGHTKTPSHDKFIRDDSRKTGPIGIVHHLQKTMSGGIMLMELSFREQYFCVKLYICEYSRLGTPVNQHVCIYTEQNFHFMLNVVFLNNNF